MLTRRVDRSSFRCFHSLRAIDQFSSVGQQFLAQPFFRRALGQTEASFCFLPQTLGGVNMRVLGHPPMLAPDRGPALVHYCVNNLMF